MSDIEKPIPIHIPTFSEYFNSSHMYFKLGIIITVLILISIFIFRKKLRKQFFFSLLTMFLISIGLYYFVEKDFESFKNTRIHNQEETYFKLKKEEEKNKFIEDWKQQIRDRNRDNLFKTFIIKFGDDNEKIKVQSASTIKATAYYTMSNDDLIYRLKKLGFEEIVFTDGSEQNTWKFNLKEL